MLTHNDLKKGTTFVMEKQPYQVLDYFPIKKAQGRAIIQTRLKNLVTGAIIERNFHQGDSFEEAEIEKIELKFLYSHREKYFFSKKDNPSERIEMAKEKIGMASKYLRQNEIIDGAVFNGEIISISLPIKVQLKVVQAPPGVLGDSSQGASKSVVLETGAEVNVPLFIKEGDVIEINTETEEYSRRV